MTDASEVFKTLSVEQIIAHGPLLAGHFLNAFYSALLLKKLSGVQIDLKIEQETVYEVFSKWNAIIQLLVKSVDSLSKEPLGPA